MALSDNRFDISSRTDAVFLAHAITVQVTPSQAGQSVQRDKFLRPTGPPPTPVNVQIVMNQEKEEIQQTAEGGIPVESIEFFVLPGQVNENDEVTWNGHQFRISSLWPASFGGLTQLVSCKATRMVGT